MYVSPPPETAVSLPDTLPTPFVHGQNNHLLCFCKQTWLRIWTAILVAFLQPHSLQPTRESFFAMLACYLNAKDNSKQKGKFGSSGQGQSRIFQRLSLKSHQHQTACKQCLPACCTQLCRDWGSTVTHNVLLAEGQQAVLTDPSPRAVS